MPAECLVPFRTNFRLFLGLACALIVETSFRELAVSFIDRSPSTSTSAVVIAFNLLKITSLGGLRTLGKFGKEQVLKVNRGGSRTSTAGGGAQVTNEAEALRREAPKGGGWGRGSRPPAGGGPGIFLRNCIEMVHSECILR